MTGKRLPDRKDGNGLVLNPGEYVKVDGWWYARTPRGEFVANLGNGVGTRGHRVTEHPDGTITADPSILVTNGKETWHGYLEKGVWREV